MLARLLLALSALAAAALPARADDIRIYHGTVLNETFATVGVDVTKRPTYLIIDHTSLEIALVTYDPKARTHFEVIEAATYDAIRPNTPIGPASEAFVYSGAPEPATPVDVRRFRSVGKLSMQPVSSTATELLPKKLAYASFFVGLAAYNSEASGTFKYQKKLTIASNDVSLDLAGAIAMVIDDLRDRNVID